MAKLSRAKWVGSRYLNRTAKPRVWRSNVDGSIYKDVNGRPGPKIGKDSFYGHSYSRGIKSNQKFSEKSKVLIPRHMRKGSPVKSHIRRNR